MMETQKNDRTRWSVKYIIGVVVVFALVILGFLFEIRRIKQSPRTVLVNSIDELDKSVEGGQRTLFDQFQSNLTRLIPAAWKGRLRGNGPDALKRECASQLDSSLWRIGGYMEQFVASELDELQLRNLTVSLLDLSHSSAIAYQNLTERLEAVLKAMYSEHEHGGTIWKVLKSELGETSKHLEAHKQNDFDQQMMSPNKQLETVIAVKPGGSVNDYERRIALNVIDTKGNEYVLSKPSGIKSMTEHSEDPALVIDILLILTVGYLCSVLAEYVGLPGFFGSIIAGVLLGPNVLNKIRNIVQINSIGQIGSLLLLLELGLEFSIEHLVSLARITIFGTLFFSFAVSLLWGLASHYLVGSGLMESIFIGFILSFSSTAVSIKCIKKASEDSINRAYLGALNITNIITGILLMQDALFSTALSVLPVLVTLGSSTWYSFLWQLLIFVAKAGFISALTSLAAYISLIYFKSFDMSILIVAFSSIIACHSLGISYEFGAFFTGMSFSILKSQLASDEKHGDHKTIKLLKDIFCVIFFASLGLLVDIKFAKSEFLILLSAAVLTICAKTAIMYFIGRSSLGMNNAQSVLVGLNLSQISELSVAIGNKGYHFGILSYEIYLLFIGTSLICFIIVPLAWRLALSRMDKYDLANTHASTEMEQA